MTSVKINYTDSPIESIEWDFGSVHSSARISSGTLWLHQGDDTITVPGSDIQAFAEALLKMARQEVK